MDYLKKFSRLSWRRTIISTFSQIFPDCQFHALSYNEGKYAAALPKILVSLLKFQTGSENSTLATATEFPFLSDIMTARIDS